MAGIFNLSSAEFTNAEKVVLDKGLKFVPSRTLNKFNTFIDVQKFVRKMNIQRYFTSNPCRPSLPEVTTEIIHTGLSNPSLFNPSCPIAPSVKVFRDLVIKDLEELPVKRNYSDPNIKLGLKTLCERRDLVIRPADKGGGIVVLDKTAYNEEMYNILGDSSTYIKLPSNPTSKFKVSLKKLIDMGARKGILDNKEKSYLLPKVPRIPVMYYLPKVHKNSTRPPGRPIVSGINSITSRVGKYIDYHLQPIVKSIPSYLKDTRHTIAKLQEVPYTEDLLLVTADVASLYTSIAHHLGFQAVDRFLDRVETIPVIQKLFIMDLLRFATSHNYFWYGGDFYLQEKGVAMGAKFAPSLANIFMAKWEEDVVYALERPEIVLWARYIDDILLLWKGDRTSLDTFMTILNDNQVGICLSYEASPLSIHFLDLEIFVENHQLKTRTYFKSTDRNGFIPQDSCHHPSWLGSVPRSQMLRLRRNCSNLNDFKVQAQTLKERFVEKGYCKLAIEEEIKKISTVDRSTLTVERVKIAQDNKFRHSFFTTFSTQYRQIKSIIQKHWAVLKNDPLLGPVLPAQAGVIYRGAVPLRNQLAPNIPDPPGKISFFPLSKGYHPCRKCKVW